MESLPWRLCTKGVAIKCRPGESAIVSISLLSEVRTNVKVRILDNPFNLRLEMPKDEVELKRDKENFFIKIKVPHKIIYEPAWIVKLGFESSDHKESAYIAILPVSERSKKKIIRVANKDDREYAVGAAAALEFSSYYLTYRWRNGPERGQVLEIACSNDGLNFTPIHQFEKYDYGYESFEGSTLMKTSQGVKLLYCADVNGTWKIFKTEAPSPEKISLPGDVLIEDAKDPAGLYDKAQNSYIIAYSNCKNRGHDITISISKDLSIIKTLVKSLFYDQLIKQGNKWARVHIHAGSIVKTWRYYLLFYDALPKQPFSFGSGWLGLALSEDLKNWIDLTTTYPLWKGDGIDGTFRYITLCYKAHTYFLYVEEETSISGRKDLVVYYG